MSTASEFTAIPHISFENVEVKYSDIVFGLRSVSLRIERGEFVFLTGLSGAGKSTLLKLVTKEVRPTKGRVVLNCREIGAIATRHIPGIRRQMGIVPQDFALLPRKRVYENVAYAMRAVGHSKREVREKVPNILERVHIGHRADAFPHELSGGEQQRVAIGRALVNDPPLLIADEPTGNLDPEHSWEIMELLKELNNNGTTVVVASHDMMVVDRMGERIVMLDRGLVVSDRKADPIDRSGDLETGRAVVAAEERSPTPNPLPHLQTTLSDYGPDGCDQSGRGLDSGAGPAAVVPEERSPTPNPLPHLQTKVRDGAHREDAVVQ